MLYIHTVKGVIVQMIKMRDAGKLIAKSKLFDRYNRRYKGRCIIGDFQDIETRRTMTMARFTNSLDGQGGEMLLDARILWMNEDGRFTLTGFERAKVNGDVVEVMQSWLVFPNDDAPPMPEGR